MKNSSLKDKYHTLIFMLVMIAFASLVVSGVFVYIAYPYFRPYFNPENFELLLESVKNDWQLYLGLIFGYLILPITISIVSITLAIKLVRDGEYSAENPFFLPLQIGFIGYITIYFIFVTSLPGAIFLPNYLIFFLLTWWVKKSAKNITNSHLKQ